MLGHQIDVHRIAGFFWLGARLYRWQIVNLRQIKI
jgi:hypothetical protein